MATYPNPFAYLGILATAAIKAVAVQDASNLSGVLHSWYEVLCDLKDIAHHYNLPNVWHSRHPISILYLSKVSSLMGIGTTEDDDFSTAYRACKVLSAYSPLLADVHGALTAGGALDLISRDIRSGGLIGGKADSVTLGSCAGDTGLEGPIADPEHAYAGGE